MGDYHHCWGAPGELEAKEAQGALENPDQICEAIEKKVIP